MDDNGNVSGESSTDSSTSCRDLHNYFCTIVVAIVETPTSLYQLTAQCNVRWVWNHCLLAVVGAKDVMVLAREKKDHYAIYWPLSKGTFWVWWLPQSWYKMAQYEQFPVFWRVLPLNRLPDFTVAVFSQIRRCAHGVRGCLLADHYLALVS